jgi:phosphosulfolactate synthase (CoM biosynthesis protein A)
MGFNVLELDEGLMSMMGSSLKEMVSLIKTNHIILDTTEEGCKKELSDKWDQRQGQ